MSGRDIKKFPRTVDKALDILEYAGRSDKPLGVSELGAELGINKSTVYRILQLLLSRGYVDKDPENSKYRIGYKILELNTAIVRNIGLRKVAISQMEQLARKSSETIGLATMDKAGVIYLDQVGGEKENIRIHFLIGSRMPFHCTGTGKAMLAFLEDTELREILEGRQLQSYTANTITDHYTLWKELRKIRKQGYALNDGEYQDFVRVIASPIFNSQDRVVGALALAAFKHRLKLEMVPRFGELVRSAAAEISRSLGCDHPSYNQIRETEN